MVCKKRLLRNCSKVFEKLGLYVRVHRRKQDQKRHLIELLNVYLSTMLQLRKLVNF